jgi:hypothetical protein
MVGLTYYEMVDVNGRADSTMVKRKTDKQWWKNTIKKNKHLATWKIGEELKWPWQESRSRSTSRICPPTNVKIRSVMNVENVLYLIMTQTTYSW